MLLTTPAPGASQPLHVIAATQATQATLPDKVVLTEADLASRWGMSPKTLQRWRMEGRGPHYLKLGKRVSYPVKAVIAFENGVQHVSTSQKANG